MIPLSQAVLELSKMTKGCKDREKTKVIFAAENEFH